MEGVTINWARDISGRCDVGQGAGNNEGEYVGEGSIRSVLGTLVCKALEKIYKSAWMLVEYGCSTNNLITRVHESVLCQGRHGSLQLPGRTARKKDNGAHVNIYGI